MGVAPPPIVPTGATALIKKRCFTTLSLQVGLLVIMIIIHLPVKLH